MTTRRAILQRFTAAAGFAGGYAMLHALGMTGDEAWAGTPELAPGSGKGVKVAIIGAGLAGLAAAYELGKAGYQCTVFEARDRVGGRNWTIRRGAEVEYLNGHKQVCVFDPGQYFNAGPARIPAHHQATLSYCREFGIAMETEVNWSGRARIQRDSLNDGKPIEMRQAIYDYRGHLAELLAKVANKGALDDVFSADDRALLKETLPMWGRLSDQLTYDGSERTGYEVEPAAGTQSAQHRKPLPFSVVGDPLVQAAASFADVADFQATMQQPVGGMDRIPAAFEARLSNVIRKGCEVLKMRRGAKKGADVFYHDRLTGAVSSMAADYVICTVPITVMDRIDGDFAKPVKAALTRNRDKYWDGYKIAFQSPRFWETDDHIYGGLSFTDRDTLATWYPSDRFHSPQGILVAGYAFDGKMASRPILEQEDYARQTVERLHPGRSHLMRSPVAVHWGEIPYSRGLATSLPTEDAAGYELLSKADGPYYFAGDYMSHVASWQQGAFCSAHRIVNMIAERQKALSA